MALSVNDMKDRLIYTYDEANKGNVDVFDELLSPDFASYGGAGFGDLKGLEAFKTLYRAFLNSFPDLAFVVDDLVGEGNMCVARGTLSGTHKADFMGMAPPSGNFAVWTGTAWFRFNDAGFADARWQEFDGPGFLQQIGAMPKPDGGGAAGPAPVPPRVLGGRYSSPSENKAAVRRFIDEVWNKGNLAVSAEVFHPEATSPSAAALPPGPEGVNMIVGMFRNAMPDYHIDITDLIADGDRVCARFSQSGTQTGDLMGIPPSGKHATWNEIGILRFAGGQIVESWYELDMLGLMQQLGVGGGAPRG